MGVAQTEDSGSTMNPIHGPMAQPGSMYQTRQGELVTVIALEDDTAVVDRNHPLAGKHLVVDVVVLTVERPQSLGGEDFAPSTEI